MTTHHRKLGKKPARLDPRTYKLTAPLAFRLPEPPPSVNWAQDVQWPMWCNDTLGCCTQVSVASAIRTWTGAALSPVQLTGQEVVDNYSAESGYTPGNPATDQGGVEVEVLSRWCRVGYERPGQTRDYLTAFGYINPCDTASVHRAISMLGGLYIGLSLPNYACEGNNDWVIDPQADNTIAGGHAVWLHGYDQDWLYLNTWGAPKRMSWQFFSQFSDEAYGLISRQNWTTLQGVSPEHENLDSLVDELKATAEG
ncbi:C1 family peptidase [Acetobacter oeni]|uniref:Peptidase C39-like domain-containing protein n=1 Tax=Acetobacter oeni TaxID=304077 RepID=A0A511XLC0_9PROT|nr:hypothetical protein [Acetobacter oeni]MBB3883532.1 hypothetical protein [Acetobacter oeni]NHO19571.1 hypothetical protein [Acetobacter oeni]GBR03097.1 hypothetical protein AA21952_0956 [Acetobacter oeni LMG 21952]GEN63753.1 hypothetical protein AOE01nite_19770 [Acetobacter oeni]